MSGRRRFSVSHWEHNFLQVTVKARTPQEAIQIARERHAGITQTECDGFSFRDCYTDDWLARET